MREAGFEAIFCGIETPEPEALSAIDKGHNMVMPLLDAVKIINDHGMQVVSGIILGLDTDTLESGTKVLNFIEKSQIPMLTINLLQALPQTPLYDRLLKAGRIDEREDRESNVDFLMPYDQVLAMWRDCMERAYRPDVLLARYAHQTRVTWPNRLPRPNSKERTSWPNIRKGLIILGKLLWHVGLRGDYRLAFWKFALPLMVRGQIEALLTYALPAHHLIMFARDACSGRGNASHYSAKLRQPEAVLMSAAE
jgi:hopanoid C-2 methylase